MKDLTGCSEDSAEVTTNGGPSVEHTMCKAEVDNNGMNSKCENINDSGSGSGNSANVSPTQLSENVRDSILSSYKSESDEDTETEATNTTQNKLHCKIVTAFTRAFAKQNIHFENGKSMWMY